MSTSAVIELHYLPCVQYFTKFILYDHVLIEAHENYQKGSYRNKAHIVGSQGIEVLSVALKKGKHQQQAIRDTRISYAEPWHHRHCQSIRSAYGRAPYFDHYWERLEPILLSQPEYLFDLNWQMLSELCTIIGLPPVRSTTGYQSDPTNHIDLRGLVNRKSAGNDQNFRPEPYFQQFADRQSFAANLSVLDLVFAMGPETRMILQSSIATHHS